MLELELVVGAQVATWRGLQVGLIRHLEVDIRHSSFWSLEITEVPSKALLKRPRVLVGA